MKESAAMRPVRLRCNAMESPIGIDDSAPRLSWAVRDRRPGARQTAWQVQVSAGAGAFDEARLAWDSGRVKGDPGAGARYGGAPAASRARLWWRVRAWDAEGAATPWSEPAFWETGLLEPGDWKAQWIGLRQDSSGSVPCPLLRRSFTIPASVRRARLYVAALGLFEAWINGRRVGDDRFVPGWTDYNKRVDVLAYDVTALLREGENVLGAILGEGWYSGTLLWYGTKNHYGDTPRLLAQLEVETADGGVETVATDGRFKVATGPILASDMYHGESYDARLEMSGWSESGFDDSRWPAAEVLQPAPRPLLSGRPAPAVRAIQELAARSMSEPAPGVYVYDLGQNMVGWARLRLRAEAGTRVTLRFAEMLNPDGTLYTANLRSARATDRYICRGGGEETWEPRFTFHGFRYVEVTGLASPPAEVTGVVLHSAMEPTGSLATSDELLNRLWSCIVWGQKGNFLELPTDCPQRDERLGWTGDAQVFMPTACFNFDVAAFFSKWLRDLEDAQAPDGAVPHVVPDVLTPAMRRWKDAPIPGAAAWADAAVICPWTHYLYYGDQGILRERYGSMSRWIEFQERTSRDLIRPSNGFGDWLDPDVVKPGIAPTPKDLVGTAYFARTAGIMSRAARALGRREDARRFAELRVRVAGAFRREFVSPAGRVVGDTQTGYLLALAFDLLPAALIGTAFSHLVRLVESRGRHLATGFVGTPLLLPVLTRFGRADLAFDVLLQTDYPGWLYPVTNGATTMWERWNSWTKEGGFGDVSMNSFNHYAYGAVGVWMAAAIGGIALDESHPGFSRFVVEPLPDRRITSAECRHLSPRGEIRTRWERRDGELTLELTVPPDSAAEVRLHTDDPAAVRVDGRPPGEAPGSPALRADGTLALLAAAAGSWRITCPQRV